MPYASSERPAQPVERYDRLRRPEVDPPATMRFGWPVWTAVLSVVVLIHLALFGYMQNLVDMRPCIGYSPDPLMRLIPFNEHWMIVTMTGYLLVASAALLAMFIQAYGGRQFPVLRLGIASSITSVMRMVTLYLIPLCRPSVAAGGPPPLHTFTTVSLYFFNLPFRPFALNDLVFSGHTAIYLLILYATPHWPKAARIGFAAFLLLMMYGLVAMRDHYTIDILLAIPCSFFADRIAVAVLSQLERFGHARTVSA